MTENNYSSLPLEHISSDYVRPDRAKTTISMQINMHPFDVDQIAHVLPHQIKVWGGQVDKIFITVDTHLSEGGRYSGKDFEQKLSDLRALYPAMKNYHDQLFIDEVDYGDEAMRDIAQSFFNQDRIPIKACHGGPFYCCYYGLKQADADYILHMDCDMLFGGMSQHWIEDAIALLNDNQDVVFVEPHPGPPHPKGVLKGHSNSLNDGRPVLQQGDIPAYRFNAVSTRIFFVDMNRLKEKMLPLVLFAPSFKDKIRGFLLGNPLDVDRVEWNWRKNMQESNVYRLAFLGSIQHESQGMWSLHPPFHCKGYHQALPHIIQKIESDFVPNSQRGDYNLVDDYYDWSQERKKRAFIPRMKRRIYDMLQHFFRLKKYHAEKA